MFPPTACTRHNIFERWDSPAKLDENKKKIGMVVNVNIAGPKNVQFCTVLRRALLECLPVRRSYDMTQEINK